MEFLGVLAIKALLVIGQMVVTIVVYLCDESVTKLFRHLRRFWADQKKKRIDA